MEQVLNNQTLLLETLANAITRPMSRGQGMNDKLMDFLQTKASCAGANRVLICNDSNTNNNSQ